MHYLVSIFYAPIVYKTLAVRFLLRMHVIQCIINDQPTNFAHLHKLHSNGHTVLSSEEKRHYITYVLNRNGPIFSVIWRSNAWKNYIFRIAKYSAIIELNMPGHFLVILLVFWQKCLGNQVKNGQISLTILVSNSCHAVQPTMHFSYAARNCFTLMCLLLHTFHFRLHRGTYTTGSAHNLAWIGISFLQSSSNFVASFAQPQKVVKPLPPWP